MPNSKWTIIAAVFAFSATSAFAQDAPRDRYVTGMVGYSKPDPDLVDTERGQNVAGLFGYAFSPRFSLEANLTGSTFETGSTGTTDYYQQTLSLDGVFNFRKARGTRFTPFLVLGIGAARDDLYPDARDGNAMVANIGLGFVTKPLAGNGMRLRVEARYVLDDIEDGYAEPRASIGLEFPLAGGKTETKIVTEVLRVEVPREVPRPWTDTDGDGVDDDHDRCPGTPRGLRADATGCIFENQRLELRGVNFEFGKARLTPTAMNVLDLISEGLESQNDLRLEVAGHTDSVGSDAANLNLSRARAASVRAYLIEKGVPADRLTSVGYGESEPLVSPEKDDADRERNRRVELRVLSSSKPVENK